MKARTRNKKVAPFARKSSAIPAQEITPTKAVATKRPDSRKSNGDLRPRTRETATTKAVGTKRPKYIILFREPTPGNVSLLSSKLKVGQASGVSARAGQVILRNNHEWAARPRVYERLGIAVADLDSNEFEALAKDPSVAAVLPNERRRIPPIFEYREGQDHALQASSALSTLSDPSRLNSMQWSENPALAYATGIRDAAELLVRLLAASAADGALRTLAAAAANHSWALSAMGLDESYRRATGAGVRVAVLDTGIDQGHPDFSGRLATMELESFIPGETVQDGHGHGTHCAGVIAGAAKSSGPRRYSVAPDAELIIGKVLNDDGEGFDDQIIDGIDWAADAGAQIISMSLGSPRKVGGPFRDEYEVIAATRLAESPGILIVAASGNERLAGLPVGNPAACPSIVAVGALDRHQRVAPFSCGQMDEIGKVDFAAPGVGIHSAWSGGGFKTISGTSMATPHVAGVCALLLELEPTLSPRQLWKKLETGCRNLGIPSDFGAGLVQVPM